MGKSTINGPFSIAMLVYQRVDPTEVWIRIATGPSETARPWRHWGRLTGAIPANPRDSEVGNLTDFLIGLANGLAV